MKRRLTIKQLQAAAKELSTEMGIEPAIEAESTDRKYLISRIIDSAQLILEEDEFSDQTESVLEALEDEDEDEDDLDLEGIE